MSPCALGSGEPPCRENLLCSFEACILQSSQYLGSISRQTEENSGSSTRRLQLYINVTNQQLCNLYSMFGFEWLKLTLGTSKSPSLASHISSEIFRSIGNCSNHITQSMEYNVSFSKLAQIPRSYLCGAIYLWSSMNDEVSWNPRALQFQNTIIILDTAADWPFETRRILRIVGMIGTWYYRLTRLTGSKHTNGLHKLQNVPIT